MIILKNTEKARTFWENLASRINRFEIYTMSTRVSGEDLIIDLTLPYDLRHDGYPEIFTDNNPFGKGYDYIRFQIATTGYGDHSIAMAYKAKQGLSKAIFITELLRDYAEFAGYTVEA